MENCKRERCFGNVNGKCMVLTDTEGQDKCRFYREDLDIRKICREIEKTTRETYKNKVKYR